MQTLVPKSFWDFDSFRMPSILDDDDVISSFSSNNLSISEDEDKVYVEAHVPGIKPDDVEVTFEKGQLWIRASAKEEDSENKKYYRKASRSYSYRVNVPGNIDLSSDPEAEYENGVMLVTFSKTPESKPKKIEIKRK